jgi:nucleotide-binding universal stress UspA family protein
MYEHILVPYDGSNEARRGAEQGIELAAALGATIHALYVVDMPDTPRTVYYTTDDDKLHEEYEAHGRELTEELCGRAEESGVDCVTALKFGQPSREIVDYAEEEGIDLVVMGSAYGGRFRALLGGTTDRVVRTSSVPVMTHRIRMQESPRDEQS